MKRLLALPILTLALTIPAPAQAAPTMPAVCKRVQHPACARFIRAAVVEAPTVVAVRNGDEIELHAAGLEPGDRYAFTYQAVRDDGTSVWIGGSNGDSVRADGTYKVGLDLPTLYWHAGTDQLDRVVIWLRPVGSPVSMVTLGLVEYDL